jgi:FSR family fosmidomycin resistance protein-like MFS transporter
MSSNVDVQSREINAALTVLGALSFCHLLNDMMQSLLPAMYPILKTGLRLDFGQIGLVTFVYQVTASLFQPLVGLYADRRPMPYALAFGMGFTLTGLLLLANASTFPVLLLGAAVIGLGSSVFHPESSRVARVASGGRHGFAQSVFQVGGNAGSAIGPLAAAFIVLPNGQGSVAWFALAALLGIVLLTKIGSWYARQTVRLEAVRKSAHHALTQLPRGKVVSAMAVLIVLIFSKYFYMASLTSYYTFYLIERFQVSVWNAQVHLFVFLAAVAIGTFAGGPIGDRIGRKYVIWFSILGVLPVLDRRAERADRLDSRVRVFGDPRLRAGARARQGRHDLGTVLRAGVRHGWPRCRSARARSRCCGRRVRVSHLRVLAGARHPGRIPAEDNNQVRRSWPLN